MNIYEKSMKDCLEYFAKRCVILAAKLVGFKSFCLALATYMLWIGQVSEEAWLTIAVTVICSASGLSLMDSLKGGMRYERKDSGSYSGSVLLGNSAGRTGKSSKQIGNEAIGEGKRKLRDSATTGYAFSPSGTGGSTGSATVNRRKNP